MQRVQNTLARIIARQGKFDHIKPVLKELHWLPIENRVTFKLATLTYNIKSTGQPVYLHNLLSDMNQFALFKLFLNVCWL